MIKTLDLKIHRTIIFLVRFLNFMNEHTFQFFYDARNDRVDNIEEDLKYGDIDIFAEDSNGKTIVSYLLDHGHTNYLPAIFSILHKRLEQDTIPFSESSGNLETSINAPKNENTQYPFHLTSNSPSTFNINNNIPFHTSPSIVSHPSARPNSNKPPLLPLISTPPRTTFDPNNLPSPPSPIINNDLSSSFSAIKPPPIFTPEPLQSFYFENSSFNLFPDQHFPQEQQQFNTQIGGLKLIDATKSNDIQTMQILLNNNANVNQQDDHGKTALHWAVHAGNMDCIRLLLQQKNIDVNIADNEGQTPLHYSAYCHPFIH